jgi:hypothetical protein
MIPEACGSRDYRPDGNAESGPMASAWAAPSLSAARSRLVGVRSHRQVAGDSFARGSDPLAGLAPPRLRARSDAQPLLQLRVRRVIRLRPLLVGRWLYELLLKLKFEFTLKDWPPVLLGDPFPHFTNDSLRLRNQRAGVC